jgi:uncharacterized membrane protein
MIRTIVTQFVQLTGLRSRLALLGRAIRRFPADLALALLYTLLAAAVLLSGALADSPIRTAVGIPLLFFLPGFTFLSVLFPRRAQALDPTSKGALFTLHTRGIDGVERAVLSFGMSLVLVPIVAVVFAALPLGFGQTAIVATVVAFVLVCTFAGAVARVAVPADERYELPLGDYATRARAAIVDAPRLDGALNVLLVVSVVVGLSAIGMAAINPQDGTQYSDVSLLTQTDSGELVAGDYPTDFVRDEPRPVTLSIANYEDAATDYTVVVVVQRVGTGADGEPTVLEQRRVDTFGVSVAAGATERVQHAARSPITGENLRLAYLVYTDAPPERPTIDNAYRYVHLWIDVSDSP